MLAMASSAPENSISTISTDNDKFDGVVREPASLTEVSLEDGVKKKQPRRILHFSDGILEEYSTDEEDEADGQRSAVPPVDVWNQGSDLDSSPKSLAWLPWLWYYIVAMSSGALGVADSCGEKLAWFFGITSPKYQYAIDEHNRMQREEAEDRERDEREQAAERMRYTQRLSQAEGAVVYEASDAQEEASRRGAVNPGFETERF